jgi:hypothetical protein
VAASKQTGVEREALTATIEQLRAERDDAIATRGAAMVMRNAANAPSAYKRESNRILHFLPALVVILAAIVVGVLTHVI